MSDLASVSSAGATARVLVAGAGGFIGGHLALALLTDGHDVRAVDRKPLAQWHQVHAGVENIVGDLSDRVVAERVVDGCAHVYDLACDMGGMGFIENNQALCMLSVLGTTNLLVAARDGGVERLFFSSTACVYPVGHQRDTAATPLRESDAYPADPEGGYGWVKLFSERMCRHFTEDFGLETRVARYHNVYGPHGTWHGGREKAPAAICRKVAESKRAGHRSIEVWGDGRQTRSFQFIDDCIEGTRRLMESNLGDPVNIGSSELVSIEDLICQVEEIAGISVERRYNLAAPQGVRGRNSDNTLIRSALGWEPTTPLAEGLRATYEWIEQQVLGSRVRA